MLGYNVRKTARVREREEYWDKGGRLAGSVKDKQLKQERKRYVY